MSAFTPKPGDQVFSPWGAAAEYVCNVPAQGHIVLPFYDGPDDGAPILGEATCWSAVYEKPPTEVLNKEIAQLVETKNALHDEVATLREERYAMEQGSKARMAKLQRHEKLKRLEDFLDGKLTHYAVIPDYGSPSVMAVADAKSDESRFSSATRLLSLFGQSNGDIAWRLHRYSDGSGSSSMDVVPCCSEAEAIKAIRERSEVVFDAWLKGKRSYQEEGCKAGGFATVSTQFGFSVPPELVEWEHTASISNAEDVVKKAKVALDAAQAKLNALIQPPKPEPVSKPCVAAHVDSADAQE